MSYDLLKVVPMEMFLDCLAIRLVAPRAAGQHLQIAWYLPDLDQRWLLSLDNAALTYRRTDAPVAAQAAMVVTHARLAELLGHELGIAQAIAHGIEQGEIALEGDRSKVQLLLSMLDEFEPMFNVVEP